jgi:heptosyltransferase-1
MRVLLVRLSALGDLVVASGLLAVLRERWPEARVDWLVESPGEALLAHEDRIDRLIVLPAHGGSGAFLQTVRTLRSQHYDLAIETHGLLKGAFWARASGAPRRIGLGSREGSSALLTERVELDRGDPHFGSEYRRLADYLGTTPDAYQPRLVLGQEDRREASEALGGNPEPPYAALCPFTTRPQKHWFEENWRELGEGLRAEGLQPVLLGGPGDAPQAHRIQGELPWTDLTGRLSLRGSAAVLEGATVAVGVDTGLTHMASVLGTPTLALFGATRPYLHLPKGARGQVLYHPLPCSPCRRKPTCNGAYTCMRLHTPQSVLATARSLRAA